MSDQPFERAVRDWLDHGSDRAPSPAVHAVLLAVKTTPQERDLWIARRFTTMPTYLRLMAVTAVVAVVGVGAIWYMGRSPDIGPPTSTPMATPAAVPSPSLSPTATTPIVFDPYTWTRFTSEVYGYTTEYPPGWTVDHTATRPWDPALDLPLRDQLSPAIDLFLSANGNVAVAVWRVPTPTPTSDFRNSRPAFIAWAEEFCTAMGHLAPCDGISEREIPMCHYTPGCSPDAMIVPFNEDVVAFFGSAQNAVTVVQVLRADSAPEVAEYGGAVRLLQAFLDPINVRMPPPEQGE